MYSSFCKLKFFNYIFILHGNYSYYFRLSSIYKCLLDYLGRVKGKGAIHAMPVHVNSFRENNVKMKKNIHQDFDSGNSDDEDITVEEGENIMDSTESDHEIIEDESVTSSKPIGNLAWADAMAKILKTNKPKRRKTIVLSRAKRVNQIKVSDIKEEEKLDFEIEGDSKIDVKIEPTDNDKENSIKRLKKKEWASKGHVKPSVLEREREKALQKIATRGVVQLFNAVKEHQKTVEKDLEDAGPMEHKRDRVLKSLDKRSFLDVLMGPSKSQPVSKLIPQEIKEDTDNPTWSILRDDFMMSSKLKDWDKNLDVKDEPEM